MPTNVQVPGMGESINEAVLVKWHKQTGEAVGLDEPVAELETDKANVDVPSTAAGVLTQRVTVGTKVKIGEVIATVDANGQATTKAQTTTSAPPKPEASAPDRAVAPETSRDEKLSSAAKRMVEEHNLDATKISPTGPGNRITKEDVVNFMDDTNKPGASAPGSSPSKTQTKPATDVYPGQAKAIIAPTSTTDGPVRKVAMSKIRKKIAETLVKSQQSTATLTTFNEIDMSNLMAIRTKFKEQFEKKHGVGLGFMSFFAKAACQALREWERVNASIDGDDIVYHDYVHLGIAVSTDRGLAVPVLRNVHTLSFAQIESEIKRLATATRDGKLQISELSGGTFTITNGGVFGSLMATPIINPPQVAILGMHAIKERPVAINGQVVVRPMMYVALSYDHRMIDGKESVQFLVRLKELIEDPQRLMLDV